MSGERKSIVIDTSSLLGGSTKRQSRRNAGSGERKIRPSSIVQPSTLKKTLLERIKQHQRTRERGRERERDDTGSEASGAVPGAPGADMGGKDDNFSQSMDFLRKLALKRRQQQQNTTQRRRPDTGVSDIRTPEAQMLNHVAGTLHHGEIVTSTGLLGLPVVPTMSPAPVTAPVTSPPPAMISLAPTPMPAMPAMSMPQQSSSLPEPMPMPMPMPIPKITDLADMYNNTIASATKPVTTTETGVAGAMAGAGAAAASTSEPALHIPEKPEDYLPSIFIKEEPPHGCLKGGKKPTFREWATKILNKPVESIKNMLGGGGEEQSTTGNVGGGVGGDGGGGGGGIGGANKETSNDKTEIDPENIAGMRVKIRKTKKKRYHIGKHDNVVGVLLKNKQTQRHIQSQHLTLKQKTIGEIRKYLYDHHLLKIGSNAPPDVLRRMYEDAILTGDVKNTNNDVLLHNFMSGGGGGGGGEH